MDFNEAKDKLNKSVEFFATELGRLRGGRVSPSIVEDIKVEAYGQKTPINQLGSISVLDANMIAISIWDKSVVEDVKKAIEASDIGITPIIDGQVVKLPIPPMSEERRADIAKMVGEKEEEAKVSVRQIRKDFLSYVDRQEKDREFTEDDVARFKKQIQESVDASNKSVEELSKKKQEEIMKI